MAGAVDVERFFSSLAGDLDADGPLRWGFLLGGLSCDQVGRLMSEVAELGFAEAEPLTDWEREGKFVLGFGEVRVHTAQSFVKRVLTVEQLALREGLVLLDFSAGRPD